MLQNGNGSRDLKEKSMVLIGSPRVMVARIIFPIDIYIYVYAFKSLVTQIHEWWILYNLSWFSAYAYYPNGNIVQPWLKYKYPGYYLFSFHHRMYEPFYYWIGRHQNCCQIGTHQWGQYWNSLKPWEYRPPANRLSQHINIRNKA